MHNCKSTQEKLNDLALAELEGQPKNQLLAELSSCATCHEEYVSLIETLHSTRQALLSTLPAENFWPGYHERLINRLENQTITRPAANEIRGGRIRQTLRSWMTASIRVPAPVAAALLLLVFATITLSVWSSGKSAGVLAPPQPPAVITKTVTVTVPQEKIVTKVVYRDRDRLRLRSDRFLENDAQQQIPGAIAQKTGTETVSKPAISLVGFKPTDQVKLQVIKGSYRDER